MSQPSEQITEAKKSSQDDSENSSESKLEEGSTTSEEDMFLSIQYPSPPNFPTPYLHNWDFGDPKKALKYIMKNFNSNVGTGLAALSLLQGLSLHVVDYIIKLFLLFPLA